VAGVVHVPDGHRRASARRVEIEQLVSRPGARGVDGGEAAEAGAHRGEPVLEVLQVPEPVDVVAGGVERRLLGPGAVAGRRQASAVRPVPVGGRDAVEPADELRALRGQPAPLRGVQPGPPVRDRRGSRAVGGGADGARTRPGGREERRGQTGVPGRVQRRTAGARGGHGVRGARDVGEHRREPSGPVEEPAAALEDP
jgi:hypothetical protein